MKKLITTLLVLGLLTLNGCMLKRVFSDDESGMHQGGHEHGMMMHSADENE